jgi:hypothetical protein
MVMTGAIRSRLLTFGYLQILDLLTTLAFLSLGVREGNPLVQFAMTITQSPLIGLALVKSSALAMGCVCAFRGKEGLLAKVNLFYAGLVAWNLIAIILGSASR